MILAHGSDSDVTEFAKRDKINYLEEFFSLPYAKLKNYDRYVDYSNETGEDDETTVLAVNLDMDKEHYEDPVIVKEFSTDMLVNKHRSLEKDFEPDDLVSIDEEYAADDTQAGSRIAVNAFIKMYKAAKKDGYDLVINSSYRSYEEQEDTCDTYRQLYGENYVLNYVAMPGFSEHQTGLSLILEVEILMFLLSQRNMNGFRRMLINMDLFNVFLLNMKQLLALEQSHGIIVM